MWWFCSLSSKRSEILLNSAPENKDTQPDNCHHSALTAKMGWVPPSAFSIQLAEVICRGWVVRTEVPHVSQICLRSHSGADRSSLALYDQCYYVKCKNAVHILKFTVSCFSSWSNCVMAFTYPSCPCVQYWHHGRSAQTQAPRALPHMRGSAQCHDCFQSLRMGEKKKQIFRNK